MTSVDSLMQGCHSPVEVLSKKEHGALTTALSKRAWVCFAATMPPYAKEKARAKVKTELAAAKLARMPR